MRTAIIFFAENSREKMLQMTRALAKGIEAQGHQVDIIDGGRDVNSKLTIYEYIAVGVEPLTFFSGKIPVRVGEFLSGSGIVSGKRSFAFTLKKGFGSNRALTRVMKAMEHEGMYLKLSDILTSPEEAEAIGKRLHVS